jgi:hypothetical protein
MILFDKIVAGAAVALLVAAGVQTWRLNGAQRALDQERAAYASERATAAEVAQAAERAAREREQVMQTRVDELEAQSAKALAERDARIRALSAAGNGLRERVAALTAKAGGPAETSCPAAVDLQERVTVLGSMVARLDDFAGRASQAADDYADELRTCRAYVQGVTQ